MSYSISLYTHQVFLFCSNYTTRLSRHLDKTTHARNTQFEVKNKMAVSLGNFVKGNNSVKALKDYFKNISFKMSLEMLIWSVWSKIIEGIFKKSSFNNILFQKSFFFKSLIYILAVLLYSVLQQSCRSLHNQKFSAANAILSSFHEL